MMMNEVQNTRITVVPRCRGAAAVKIRETAAVQQERYAIETIPPISWLELNDENAVGWSVYFLRRVLSSFNI